MSDPPPIAAEGLDPRLRDPRATNVLRVAVVVVMSCVYFASLVSVAAVFSGGDEGGVWLGEHFLVAGVWGPFHPSGPILGWYANPLLVVAAGLLLFFRSRRGDAAAAAFATVGLAVALTSLRIMTVPLLNGAGDPVYHFRWFGPGSTCGSRPS